MTNFRKLTDTGLFRAMLSLALALLLAGSGLFFANQLSKPAMSGIGNEVQEALPDLTLTHADITFSDNNPHVGDVIEICGKIHNIGNDSAMEIRVDFYDHFQGSSTLIGTKWIPQLPPGGNETRCVEWTAGPAGLHGIVVKVDPENAIPELNEENNVADKGIEVLPLDGPLPDLTIVEQIWFSDEHPNEGETINICVVVKNIGDGAADNILVKFVDIHAGQSTLIGTKTITHLDPGATSEVCHEWVAHPAGEHVIFVKVDPENNIPESNEENNAANRGIVVEPPEQQEIYLTLVRFDNDGNGHVDDVVIVVYDAEHTAIVNAEVFIDGQFYGRTPDSGTLLAYNFSQGWHIVKIHFNGHEVQGEFYSQG